MNYHKLYTKPVEGAIEINLGNIPDHLEDILTEIEPRGGGNLSGKSFWLPDYYDWILGKDDHNTTVLVPIPKQHE